MANKRSCVYGPDLFVHEQQGKEIADQAMKVMKGVGVTGTEEKSDGSDTSRNNLERLK